jgi:predicted phage replisome organizer
MSKRYYWLKMYDNFFEAAEMEYIESLPNGKEYAYLYIKMLLKSIKGNGLLRVNDVIPYNLEMLAQLGKTSVDTVRAAVELFVNLGLMEVWDDNTLYMTATENMLGSESESAARVRAYRERKALAAEQSQTPTLEDKDASALHKSTESVTSALHCNGETLHCNESALHCNKNVTTEYRDIDYRYNNNIIIPDESSKKAADMSATGREHHIPDSVTDDKFSHSPKQTDDHHLHGMNSVATDDTVCQPAQASHAQVHENEVTSTVGNSRGCDTDINTTSKSGCVEASNTVSAKSKKAEHKHCYGEFKHVRLTDREYARMVDERGEAFVADAIRFLDEYIEEKGYKSKNHNLAMRRWVFDAVERNNRFKNSYSVQRPGEVKPYTITKEELDECL